MLTWNIYRTLLPIGFLLLLLFLVREQLIGYNSHYFSFNVFLYYLILYDCFSCNDFFSFLSIFQSLHIIQYISEPSVAIIHSLQLTAYILQISKTYLSTYKLSDYGFQSDTNGHAGNTKFVACHMGKNYSHIKT